MSKKLTMTFTPEELKAFQDFIFKLSWQSEEIDEAITDFIEDHLSDEDNSYLDEWYENYWNKHTNRTIELNGDQQ